MPNPKTQSFDADDFFYEIIARDDSSKLRAVLEAIPEWESIAVARVAAVPNADGSTVSEHHRELRAQEISDDYFMVHLAKNALFAGLSVAITATIESFLKMLGKDQSRWFIPIQDPKKLPSGNTVVKVDDLAGYDSVNRIRLINNCYKHEGGKVSNILATSYGFVRGEEIAYEKEDWSTIINDAQTFMLEIVRRVFPRSAG
jgi:hypothetical protein